MNGENNNLWRRDVDHLAEIFVCGTVNDPRRSLHKQAGEARASKSVQRVQITGRQAKVALCKIGACKPPHPLAVIEIMRQLVTFAQGMEYVCAIFKDVHSYSIRVED